MGFGAKLVVSPRVFLGCVFFGMDFFFGLHPIYLFYWGAIFYLIGVVLIAMATRELKTSLRWLIIPIILYTGVYYILFELLFVH